MNFVIDIPPIVFNILVLFILCVIACLLGWREGVLAERKRIFEKLGISTEGVRTDYNAGQALDKYAERMQKLSLDEAARQLAREQRKNT